MSERLTRNLHLIQFIAAAEPKQVIALLKILTPDQIKTLTEISGNTLRGVLDLSDAEKLRLKKYKTFLISLASEHKSDRSKKTLLVRGIRALNLLLKIALPVVERIALASLRRS
jgi:hypothetical protein